MKNKSLNNTLLIILDIFAFMLFMDIVYFINKGTITLFTTGVYLLISAILELLGFGVITGILYLIGNKIFKNEIKLSFFARISAVSLLISTLISFSRIILKVLNIDGFIIMQVIISLVTVNIIIKMYNLDLKSLQGKTVLLVVLTILLFLKKM